MNICLIFFAFQYTEPKFLKIGKISLQRCLYNDQGTLICHFAVF